MGGPDLTTMDRRAFMAGVVATALAASACSGDDDDSPESGGRNGDGLSTEELPPLPTDLPDEVFTLGVASGDPMADSVILWTRVVADPMVDDGGVGADPIPVHWEVASDEDFEDIVASGDAVAAAALAHSVHVDASSLEPDSWYWYRFKVGDRISPVARTRTTPATEDEPESFRFAFASCQERQSGYWTAHQHLAKEEVDIVFFLGDYIYEGPPADGSARPYQSPAPTDLPSYRKRWGDYKADPDLQTVHARTPWVCTWDDHEVQNNYAASLADGANPDDTEAEAEFESRRAAAYQAFYEHQPVRLDPPTPGEAELRIYRKVSWGQLARFFVLDGRQYRSDQACADTALLADAGPLCDEADVDERTMLGEQQESWLKDGLAGSDARWNVLAQQTVMSNVPFAPGVVNLDQWDGYPAARRRLVKQLREVSNPVVITGDIHLSGVGTISEEPDDATDPVVTELVGTAISSSFPLPDVIEGLAESIPSVHYVNARDRGYVVCEVTADELRADFRYVSTVSEPQAEIETGATWVIEDGNPEPTRA